MQMVGWTGDHPDVRAEMCALPVLHQKWISDPRHLLVLAPVVSYRSQQTMSKQPWTFARRVQIKIQAKGCKHLTTRQLPLQIEETTTSIYWNDFCQAKIQPRSRTVFFRTPNFYFLKGTLLCETLGARRLILKSVCGVNKWRLNSKSC